MKKVIRLTESDLMKIVKKVIKEEGFKDPSMFDKAKQQGRSILSAFGIDTSNKDDMNTLEKIRKIIREYPDLVTSIRKTNNSITAWINNKALIVDKGDRNPEIIYNGKHLDLAELKFEARMLYRELDLFRERNEF